MVSLGVLARDAAGEGGDAPSPAGEPGVSVFTVTRVHSLVDGDSRILLLLGGVHLGFGDTRIWADNVVIWADRWKTAPRELFSVDEDFRFGWALPEKGALEGPPARAPEAGEPFLTPLGSGLERLGGGDSAAALVSLATEIYAEGHVRMLSGAAASVEASKLYFHMKENRGVILKGALYTSLVIREKNNPLLVRAEEIRQIASDHTVATNAQASTCTYGHPHYDIRADLLALSGSPVDGVLTVDDPAFATAGVPIPLPDMSCQLGEEWPVPLRRLSVGRSTKYGVEVQALFGRDIDRTGQSVQDALGVAGRFHGTWFLDLDIFGKRGVGVGPGVTYSSPGLYRGYVRTWYIEDKANHDYNKSSEPIENEDRGWIQTRNRIELPDFWLLDLELSYISEKRTLQEYFEDEAKEDKGQETLAYLHRAHNSQALSLLAKYRINDFQTDTERIPEARWLVSSIPLLDRDDPNLSAGGIVFHNIYYFQNTSATQLRYRLSDQEPGPAELPTERFTRADYLGGLQAPVGIGPLKIVPFVEQRLTFYEETIEDPNKEYRYIAGAGSTASILLHRVSEAQVDFLNIDGLRHILEPTITYRNNFEADPTADELYQFDEVDAATGTETVALGLRHRMQTRGAAGEEDRKSGGAKTFFEGFYALTAYPDRDQNPTGERYGNFAFDLLWTPDLDPAFLQNLTINEEGEYNLYSKDLDVINSLVALRPYPEFEARVAHRWIRETYSYITYDFTYVLTPRWEVELGFRRDLLENRWMEEAVILRRRAHQWIFEFETSVDRSDGNRSISVSVMPISLFAGDREGSFYDPTRDLPQKPPGGARPAR